MSDPRYTDPRNSDPRLSDPVLRRDAESGGIWGWVAGLAVLALIAFIVVAGWNNGGKQANNANTPPVTTGSNAPRMSPPSTTGSGSTSPQPAMPTAPAPSAPPKPQQ